MKSRPSNIYESEQATFRQETDRLKSFALPFDVSIDAIGEMKSGINLLDVGSGPSAALGDYVRKHEGTYTALDKNVSFLASHQDKGPAVFGDVRDLPFTDNAFDIVHARFVIAHLGKDKLKAIKETSRVTKPGGKTILIDFDWTVAHGSDAFNALRDLMTSGSTLFDASYGSRAEHMVSTAFESKDTLLTTKRYSPKKMFDYQQVLKLREAGNADFGSQEKHAEQVRWNTLLDELEEESSSKRPPGFYFPDIVAVTVFKK